ncbi:MAG: hypothetical protein KF869_14225 [Phycisphaeraceae bacterium]|nr:hypothetical protein [Phycisphaeraceae bacterium]
MQPPRAAYAGLMAVAMVVAVGAAYATSVLAGGDGRAAGFAVAVVGAASLFSLLPSLIQSVNAAAHFGMYIFGASLARVFVLMIAVLAIDNGGTVVRRPFVLGVLVGAAVVLVIETAAAMVILKRLDRAGAHRAGKVSTTAEHA